VGFNSSVFQESGEGKHDWTGQQDQVRVANAGTTGKENDLIRNQNIRFTPLPETSNCLAFLLRTCICQHGLLSFHELFSIANHFTSHRLRDLNYKRLRETIDFTLLPATLIILRIKVTDRRIIGIRHLSRTLAKAYRSCCSFIHSFYARSAISHVP
jgi:hypothetical protein